MSLPRSRRVAAATALGLVVTNIGALYRMRYVFMMLLMILATEGLRQTIRLVSAKKETRVFERLPFIKSLVRIMDQLQKA